MVLRPCVSPSPLNITTADVSRTHLERRHKFEGRSVIRPTQLPNDIPVIGLCRRCWSSCTSDDLQHHMRNGCSPSPAPTNSQKFKKAKETFAYLQGYAAQLKGHDSAQQNDHASVKRTLPPQSLSANERPCKRRKPSTTQNTQSDWEKKACELEQELRKHRETSEKTISDLRVGNEAVRQELRICQEGSQQQISSLRVAIRDLQQDKEGLRGDKVHLQFDNDMLRQKIKRLKSRNKDLFGTAFGFLPEPDSSVPPMPNLPIPVTQDRHTMVATPQDSGVGSSEAGLTQPTSVSGDMRGKSPEVTPSWMNADLGDFGVGNQTFFGLANPFQNTPTR